MADNTNPNWLAADILLALSGGLPKASATDLGCIRVGSGLAIDSDGILSTNGGGYTLPPATSSTIGGVTVGTSAGDCPVLDANGKIDASVLPSGMANGRYLGTASNVSTGVAQWGLTAVRGDYFRLSTTKAYCILGSDEGAVIANWQEFGGAVSSVNGQTGDVTTIAKYVGTITGDGTATDFTLTHNLGSQDVMVQVFDTAGGNVMTGVKRLSTTQVKIVFNTAPVNGVVYKVVVVG